MIMAVKTTERVRQGKEFLVEYGYPYPKGPLWYKQLFKTSVKKNPKLVMNHEHLLVGVDLAAEFDLEGDEFSTDTAIDASKRKVVATTES